MLNRSRSTALKHCANWNAGKCSGVLINIKRKRKAGYRYPVQQILDVKKSGTDCNPDNCSYFDNIVIPGLSER